MAYTKHDFPIWLERKIYEQGLTKRVVASLVGVKPPTVTQWTSGLTSPNWLHLSRLATILRVSKAELYLRLLSPQKPDYKEKIWDQAAGSLVVEEAGGWVTDLDGKPLDFTAGRSLSLNRGILASNGHLHAVALESLRVIGA